MKKKYIIYFIIAILIFTFLSNLTFAASKNKIEKQENTLSLATGKDNSDSHHEEEKGHSDAIAPVLLIFFFILLGAILGRYLARKLNQPEVLGEILIGIIAGNIAYFFKGPEMVLIRHGAEVSHIFSLTLFDGMSWYDAAHLVIPETAFGPDGYGTILLNILSNPENIPIEITVLSIDMFSRLGIILLLFMVGLEFSVEEMTEVGGPSILVAIVGLVLPFILGFFGTKLLLPGLDINVYIFIGATLCATSIGITARVFKDLNKLKIREAKIVMGAAIIDDVLGLIVLAVVTGIISSGKFDVGIMTWITLKAFLFLGITVFLGTKYLQRNIKEFAYISRTNVKLLYSFLLLLFLAWLADTIGLATIVGAFAAGLIIKDKYFREVSSSEGPCNPTIASVMEPIEAVFAPVFFVLMGLQVNLSSFLKPKIIGVALILTVIAIIGKLAAGFVLPKGLNRWTVGFGLVPRGEVGLIFASIGKEMEIFNDKIFSIIVIIVIITTLITPPALKWSLEDKKISKETEKNND